MVGSPFRGRPGPWSVAGGKTGAGLLPSVGRNVLWYCAPMLLAVDEASPSQRLATANASRRLRTFLRYFAPLLVIAGCWSLATPIDGSPDEYRHLIYGYALATGQVSSTSTAYTVPDRIGLNRSACYAFLPEQSAACDRRNGAGGSEMITTSTSANNYPRLYYRLAGWPLALFPNDLGVYLARLVGAALSCTLLALAFVSGRNVRSGWLALGVLLATTPMAVFLIGSFNPHGLELAACTAFIASLLALLYAPTAAPVAARFTCLASLPAMVLSRPNGFVWPLVLGGLATLAAPGGWRSWSRLGRRFTSWLAVVLVVCLGYAGWWALAHASRDTGAGVIGPASDTFERVSGPLLQILTKTQTFPGDWIGTFGWLDTRVTSASLLVWFGLMGGVILIGLMMRPERELAVAGLSVLLAVLFTIAVDLYYRSSLEITVAQGRYVLPFAVLAVCLVTVNLSWVPSVQQRLPGLLGTGWVIGSVLALGEGLRRYVVGVSMRSPSGSWDPPVPPPAILLLAGVAMIFLAFVVSRRAAR